VPAHTSRGKGFGNQFLEFVQVERVCAHQEVQTRCSLCCLCGGTLQGVVCVEGHKVCVEGHKVCVEGHNKICLRHKTFLRPRYT
jgi:hypothetical protein